MKKLVVLLVFLLLVFSVSASVTLRQGEVYEMSGKEFIIESIKSDMIKVNVDGIKNIINLNEEKEVNGIDIYVSEIFYVDEAEERTVAVSLTLAFYCGDGNCDEGETKENCCNDCGCDDDFVCSDSVCKSEAQVAQEEAEASAKSADKCEDDSDCDDNDPATEDVCLSKPGQGNYCLNMPPLCKTDIECDDDDSCTVDRCVDNDCVNAKVTDYIDCLKKYKGSEEILKETSQEITKETLEEEVSEKVQKQAGFFSKMINLFLNIFK
ncbi:MAG: hypothetical protein KKA79_09505 [Nanoarchaeota archaeon]|nr:hypothetical protein [Nanoarchaeota archaeon]MCG2718513.1 hypothetical protein [Nanoarchaeota archaeon]